MHRPDPVPGADPGADDGGVPRNLLRDAVFSRLLMSILRNDYKRGQRLRLDAIAKDMRVSRTPVREALAPLESLRLVAVRRYVGVEIADWAVEHMVERIRIAQGMLEASDDTGPDDQGRFEPSPIRDCRSEVGRFCLLAAWVLRRRGRPVSADWCTTQLPLLDAFYVADVAVVSGIDVMIGARERSALLTEAQDAAMFGDAVTCSEALLRYAERLATIQQRFRPGIGPSRSP